MNFGSFASDTLAGLIGAFFGVGVALFIDRAVAMKRTARREVRLIQNLINRLATRRAFGHADDVDEVDDPADKGRCRASVSDTRERIAQVCEQLDLHPDAVPVLRDMEKACMDYLNFEEKDDLRYAMGLVALRRKLASDEMRLQGQMPELDVVTPGSRDSSKPTWLPDPRRRNAASHGVS